MYIIGSTYILQAVDGRPLFIGLPGDKGTALTLHGGHGTGGILLFQTGFLPNCPLGICLGFALPDFSRPHFPLPVPFLASGIDKSLLANKAGGFVRTFLFCLLFG